MPHGAISCENTGLPISLDVQINVQDDQEIGFINLSTPVFVQSVGGFPHGDGRIRYYVEEQEVLDDQDLSTEAKKAAQAFFSQDHPRSVSVAQAFSTPQRGNLVTGAIGDVATFGGVADGSMTVSINGIPFTFTTIDFSGIVSVADIATTLQSELQAVSFGGFTAATVEVLANNTMQINSGTIGDGSTVSVLSTVTPSTDGGSLRCGTAGLLAAFTPISDGSFEADIDGVMVDITGLDFTSDLSLNAVAATIQAGLVAGGYVGATVIFTVDHFVIKSGTTGIASTVPLLVAVSPPTGTDVAGGGFISGTVGLALSQPGYVAGTDISIFPYLNGAQGVGVITDGYTPTGLTNELERIQEASECSGERVYGWTIARTYTLAENILTAEFAEAQNNTAYAVLVTTDQNASNPEDTNDLGSQLKELGLLHHSVISRNEPSDYPDMSILAKMLSVNYNGVNTTINAKDQNLPGIETDSFTVTQAQNLDAKGYNIFTTMGQTARVYRNGLAGMTPWFMNTVINLDNLVNEIKIGVFNVFVRNEIVPYNPKGVALLHGAINEICTLFVQNGALSSREVEDSTQKSGFTVLPPFDISSAPIFGQPPEQRTERKGPPFTVLLQLTGAIQTIQITLIPQF